jgi:hypothetical protein
MGSKKRQQTINKRNRERAVAEKRALKLQRKQEKREAARNGEPSPVDNPFEPSVDPTAPAESPATDSPD